jgi:hypothetical protein
MTIRDAIVKADSLRPNMIEHTIKADWVWECEMALADLTKVEKGVNPFPAEHELAMPVPYDNVYYLYLMTLIDYYNQDSELYANDMAMYNEAMGEARRWWRRHHLPFETSNWKV